MCGMTVTARQDQPVLSGPPPHTEKPEMILNYTKWS